MSRALLVLALGACGSSYTSDDPAASDAGATEAGTQSPSSPPTPDGTDGGRVSAPEAGADDAGPIAPPLPGACGPDCHVMFVTSATFPGSLGGIAGADKKCVDTAAASKNADIRARANRFIAWISSGPNEPKIAAKLPATGSYARTDNAEIAASRKDLLSGMLKINIILDESGAQIQTGALVGASWTGTSAAGEPSELNCASWSTAAASEAGDIGRATSSDATWTLYVRNPCSDSKHLYCIDRF